MTSADTPRHPVVGLLLGGSYRRLLVAGWMVNMSMWGWALLASYLVFRLTGSPSLTALAGVAYTAPNAIGFLSGVLADCFDRRRLMLISYLLAMAASLSVAALVLCGAVRAWQVCALTLAIGSVNTLDWAARWALVADVVDRERLPHALALENASLMGGAFVGPWLAGVLVEAIPLGAAGTAVSFIAFGLSYGIGALLLLGVRTAPAGAPAPFRLDVAWTRLVEGVRVTAANGVLLGTLGVCVLINLFFYAYTPMVPVFAKDVLGVGPALMGLLGGARGVGSLIGSLLIAARHRVRRHALVFIAGSLVALTGLLLFSLSRSYLLAASSLVLAGIGLAGFSSMLTTLVLLTVAPAMRGRALGMTNQAIAAWPLGMLLVGTMADAWGASAALTVSAAAGLVLVCAWLRACSALRQGLRVYQHPIGDQECP